MKGMNSMKMMIEFDVNADIIEVPAFIIDDRELYRSRFLKWLYDKSVHHKYWVTFSNGTKGVCFRSNALIEWLNKKVLKDHVEKAVLVAEEVDIDLYRNLPSIFF